MVEWKDAATDSEYTFVHPEGWVRLYENIYQILDLPDTSFDFGVTIESEVGAGGVTMGTSLGFHYGYDCNVTNTESTLFEGSVGDIPQQSYDSTKAYSFGLFAYPFTHGDQQLTVVTYWVK